MENLNEGMGGSIENEFQDWLDIMLSKKGYEDEIETLKTVIDYAQDTLRDYSIDNWVPQTGGSTNENRKMENLNEGKNKKPNYMTELAEIDAQSAIVAMEAKINKLEEMAATKEQRLSMVSEDENLSELISKSAVKEMQKEIKEIRKMQEKLKKVYEKKNGKKPEAKEIVDEEEKVDEIGNFHDPRMSSGNFDHLTPEKEETNKEEDIDEMHCSEEDDIVKEETNEEINRWQKLAGL